jgi:hypothetical protein
VKCKHCGRDKSEHVLTCLEPWYEVNCFEPIDAHEEALEKAKELDRAVNPEADQILRPGH